MKLFKSGNNKQIFGAVLLIMPCFFFFSSPGLGADYSIITRHISEYNLNIHKKSLTDDSYRGEEGILLIRPDIAGSLGINAFMDHDYLDSRQLFDQADKSLEKARSAMASRKKGKYPGEYSETIIDSFLSYKEQTESAKRKLMAYRARITKDNDERLDEALCYGIMEKILEEGLKDNNGRLRDALGYLYNKCHGDNSNNFPLTHENVRFVNYVFNAFLEHATPEDKESFGLDMDYEYRDEDRMLSWKKLAGQEISRISKDLESILKQSGTENGNIDPLLFIALMKRESSFNPYAVSYVGAAGLTQIMPQTANNMGMKNIHMPDYFDEAMVLLQQERKVRREAMDTLFLIDEDNGIRYAEKARQLMQQSLEIKRKRDALLVKYRNELIERNNDDRLNPIQAMTYGLKYFSEMMKRQKGDISLALSSYNAGPHRVSEYGGIPPFEETVTFRNQVLKYYREYLEKSE